MKNEEKQLLSIGEIAKSLDITRRMILNYEAKGLIEADKKRGRYGKQILHGGYADAHTDDKSFSKSRTVA